MYNEAQEETKHYFSNMKFNLSVWMIIIFFNNYNNLNYDKDLIKKFFVRGPSKRLSDNDIYLIKKYNFFKDLIGIYEK